MNEPALITVVKPDGEIVAELLVSPQKPVLKLKTQIAGLEGTEVSNQELLLDGKILEDSDTLAGLGAFGASTVVLTTRAPLLSGRLTLLDLQHLVDDDSALEQAIDAYKDDPHYSAAEAGAIAAAVAGALLPAQRIRGLALLPVHIMREGGAEDPADSESAQPTRGGAGAGSVARSRSAQRAWFTHAVRVALQGVLRALHEEEVEEKLAAAPPPSPTANEAVEVASDDPGSAGGCPSAEETSKAPRRSLGGMPEAAHGSHDPRFKGAGRQLQEILQARWERVEGNGPVQATKN